MYLHPIISPHCPHMGSLNNHPPIPHSTPQRHSYMTASNARASSSDLPPPSSGSLFTVLQTWLMYKNIKCHIIVIPYINHFLLNCKRKCHKNVTLISPRKKFKHHKNVIRVTNMSQMSQKCDMVLEKIAKNK